MSHALSSTSPDRGLSFWWKPALFVLVAAVGLYYVKWSPYYLKAFAAADTHSIGASILNDHQGSPVAAALAYAQTYFLAIWKAAALAMVLGSLLQVLIPQDWLLRLFGRAGFVSTLRGGLFALPGMMCSCCAAPVAVSMRRQKVSVGAALAFCIANPTLNPATLLFMGFVLGWDFTILRLIAGVIVVLGVSLIAQRMARPDAVIPEAMLETISMKNADKHLLVLWAQKLWQLFWSIVPIYIVAVLALGAARVWLFPHVDGTMGNSMLWLILMAVFGTLFVIPTAAEIPIVQTMLSLGLGIAPAAALLITLPSISLPSLLMLRKVIETKVLVVAAALIMLIGIVSGAAAYLVL